MTKLKIRIPTVSLIFTLLPIGLTPVFVDTDVRGYLCIAEKATGFIFRNSEWVPSVFDVNDAKYIFTARDGKWLWKKTGEPGQEKYPQFCAEHASGYFDCEFMYRKVSFNKQTLRFQIYMEGSYVIHDELKRELESGSRTNNATYLEIGTCTIL